MRTMNMNGVDAPETLPENGGALRGGLVPIIDKVGVPLLWFGLGYLAATLMQRPRRSAA